MPELPLGPYSVVLADPPWRYDNKAALRGRPENHYSTMSYDEIAAFQLPPTTPDAVLFLWAPAPHLLKAFDIITAWGFVYKTQLVWVKSGYGMGWWARINHENVLVAAKAEAKPPDEHRRQCSVFNAPKGRHSEKPVALHDAIEAMWPDARRVELFARSQKVGWDALGAEAPTHDTRF